jgi:isopenicillin-N N-acyltransferase-like protein
MKHITCGRSPFEIGKHHGKVAKDEVIRSLTFYADYFQSKSGLAWSDAVAVAERFLPCLQKHCPHLVEEMRGIASGASLAFGDILALNVRTEISMGLGLVSDGCTSLYWNPMGDRGILAQNWDWETAQRENLVQLQIQQSDGRPALSIVTEAGIIGKIGLNGSGVGVCLNAIRARGVNFARLPVHIALRSVLECTSLQEAVARLQSVGVAASCHILIADSKDACGLECSHADIVELPAQDGIYTHTNHWLKPHSGPDGPITESVFLQDSVPRLSRLDELLANDSMKTSVSDKEGMLQTDMSAVEKILDDEENFPESINKSTSADNSVATLFSIVMDLANQEAKVRIGRPTEAVEAFVLQVV